MIDYILFHIVQLNFVINKGVIGSAVHLAPGQPNTPSPDIGLFALISLYLVIRIKDKNLEVKGA